MLDDNRNVSNLLKNKIVSHWNWVRFYLWHFRICYIILILLFRNLFYTLHNSLCCHSTIITFIVLSILRSLIRTIVLKHAIFFCDTSARERKFPIHEIIRKYFLCFCIRFIYKLSFYIHNSLFRMQNKLKLFSFIILTCITIAFVMIYVPPKLIDWIIVVADMIK